jgi:hypothetical protein
VQQELHPTAPAAPAPAAAPETRSRAAAAPRFALRTVQLRRSHGRVTLRLAWSGARGRVAWSVRLCARDRRGRIVARTAHGAAAGPSLRRLVGQGLPAGVRIRARVAAANGGRRLTRVLLLPA